MKNENYFVVFFVFVILLSLTLVSAARLPTIGGDDDSWGAVLNDYLSRLGGANATQLNMTMVNGTNIYPGAINSTHILNGTITDNDISDITNLTLGEKITFALGEIIDNIVDGWVRITGSLNVTENISANYFIGNGSQLDGVLKDTGDTAIGNYTFDSGTLFIDSSNDRVGIGTATPSADLHVYKSGAYSQVLIGGTGANDEAKIVIRRGATDTGAYFTWETDTTEKWSLGLNYQYSPNDEFILSSENTDNILVVQQGGNVGVGTTSPTQKLDVNGNVNVTGNITASYFHGTINYSDIDNTPSSSGSLDLEVQTDDCSVYACTATATCSAGKDVIYGMKNNDAATCDTNPANCNGYCTPGETSCSAGGGTGVAASVYAVCGGII